MLWYFKNTAPVPKQTCWLFMKCTNESSSPLIRSHCGNSAYSIWIYLPWRCGMLQLFSAWFKKKNKWNSIKRHVCQRKGLRNSWIPRQWICLVALFAFPGNSRGEKSLKWSAAINTSTRWEDWYQSVSTFTSFQRIASVEDLAGL